jgi:hypothetical protein
MTSALFVDRGAETRLSTRSAGFRKRKGASSAFTLCPPVPSLGGYNALKTVRREAQVRLAVQTPYCLTQLVDILSLSSLSVNIRRTRKPAPSHLRWRRDWVCYSNGT